MRENSIDFVTSLLQVNKPQIFELGGDYFELIQAVNPVDVMLTKSDGSLRGSLRQISQTDHIKATEYDRIVITSATLQTIKFAYGSGEFGSRRAAGSVSLLGQGGAFTQGRVSIGSGAAVQIRPANTARRRLMVQNNSAAQYLRLTMDGSAPTAANGLRLIPGDLLDLTDYCPTTEIRAIFEAGAAADVEWAEG